MGRARRGGCRFGRQNYNQRNPGGPCGREISRIETEGNLNNEYGLPLALAKMEPEHEAAVVELGMSRRGELARLTAIAAPQIGVITCVAIGALEFFADVDEIALAERELIEEFAGTRHGLCAQCG